MKKKNNKATIKILATNIFFNQFAIIDIYYF